MSSTWIPGPVRSLPLSPVMNPFVTPPHVPASATPERADIPGLRPPLLRSPSYRLSPSSAVASSATSLPVEEPLPTPILLEDTGVSAATPSVIGRLTMTELVEEFMEDLLTQEFSPILLDEDI